MKLLNAFSFNMSSGNLHWTEVDECGVQCMASQGFESYVGHADTANVFSSVLGVPVACNRANVTLSSGDKCLLGQYIGNRLSEGATRLPEGSKIKWLLITVE
jgi:hypothetical protein